MNQLHGTRGDSATWIKAAIFGLFLVICLSLYLFTPAGKFIHPQNIRELVAGHNAAPLVFILVYGFGITLFLPASLFTAIGAMLFGLYWGVLFNFAGAMLGASMSFWIGRYLGRDLAVSMIGGRLKKYDTKISANGFQTTLYLSLIFFPFTPLNFGMGLTGITFNQFFWGTFCGKVFSGIILTFFFASMVEVWTSGQWEILLNRQSILVLILFMASFFIPKAAKHLISIDNLR